ncbi:unnamed protein product [Phytophthora lilii]|uniref:Unnamed protein product n=1 Tax=Phytophthora lilii TaxID=2077276 RepID=A0A9W7CV57_9STRA|nr:unnamed protein product [Phytophthora lilii]
MAWNAINDQANPCSCDGQVLTELDDSKGRLFVLNHNVCPLAIFKVLSESKIDCEIEFLFNNGNGVWENNDENNYKINAAGAWQLTSTVSSSTLAPTPSENCYNYNGLDLCSSSTQTELPATDDQRRWQTPPRNASGWSSEYQDYRSLTGYAHVVYGSARTSATVTVRTSLMDDLIIVATCTDGSDTWKLELDPVNFVWQNNAVTQPSGMKGGQKGAIVDLFGWSYDDIAQECADFLGKAGYMGVKINPPQESVLTDAWPQSGQRNPCLTDLNTKKAYVRKREADLLACNADSGYNFDKGLDSLYADEHISSAAIAKLKIWSSDYPNNFPVCGSWILLASRFVVQNDDHDQQSADSSRDMGDDGSVLIKDKDVGKHRAFEVKTSFYNLQPTCCIGFHSSVPGETYGSLRRLVQKLVTEVPYCVANTITNSSHDKPC